MPPRLIICERTPRWLAAWRRALPAASWNWLTSALSLTQCEQLLREHPGSVAAVSVSAENFAVALATLHRWQNELPQVRTLALCSADISRQPTAVALLQEAGVLLAIDRTQQLPAAARLVRRHLRRQAAIQLPLPDAVWQRLPWPRLALNASPVIN
ncbi:hypothetical protein [Anatilimnocola floriformis]|uniref:hypothetical protein n=1 Tax=Anatilimnocola floriformis TaxID=2948575 RepID=UPI0020C2D801|nr:hypothetical protein [Anatilimnocola floriformis]